MRGLFIFIIICFLASCGSSDPGDMAKEFCACMSEESDLQKCTELAKDHKDKIGNDPDKLQKYADEVLNCTNVSR